MSSVFSRTGAVVAVSGDYTPTQVGFSAYPIVNADVANAAALAYSKLNLTGDIVNADISSSAAIASSKTVALANLGANVISAYPLVQGTDFSTVFTKGGTIPTPAAATYDIWRAPYACTVTHVRGFQDIGTGSVLTALHGASDLLVTDITISQAATWTDGGTVQNTAVSAGDTISLKIVSVSGSPTYASIVVEMTQP